LIAISLGISNFSFFFILILYNENNYKVISKNMDKRKYIIIGAIIIFFIALTALSLYFGEDEKDLDGELAFEIEEEPSEERMAEIKAMKDKDFYEDDVLENLGRTKKEIVEEYGEPNEIELIGAAGGEAFYYENKNISFVFAGEEGIVNNLYLYPGVEVLDIEVGMTFNEIEEILGEPEFRGLGDHYEGYIMTYFLGDTDEALGELELWIKAEHENYPSEKIEVLWKKFWQ